jgi:hypothetical protein
LKVRQATVVLTCCIKWLRRNHYRREETNVLVRWNIKNPFLSLLFIPSSMSSRKKNLLKLLFRGSRTPLIEWSEAGLKGKFVALFKKKDCPTIKKCFRE